MTATYRIVRQLARLLVLSWFRIEVHGLQHIPQTGACLLLPNHQSALDPLLVQGVCPRPVATMTKSTQFASPLFRWVLTACEAFPTRRYRVDPQAIRVLLRNLEAGRIVCLYPEGERSWDGRLQPLRGGALRVALKAGVPVVPVGIEGMYDIWPRWSPFPRLGRHVVLRFGTPLHLGTHHGRREREPLLPETERKIREALLELSGEGLGPDTPTESTRSFVPVGARPEKPARPEVNG